MTMGTHCKEETLTKPPLGWDEYSCLPFFRLSRKISVCIIPAD